MITTKIIDRENKEDINIRNHPFKLFGLLQPSYTGGKWDYSVIRFPKENVTEMCFPDENYDFDEMSANSIFVGAYDGDKCIGVAILQQAFFKYMYLYDLKVDPEYRGKGAGTLLIEKAKRSLYPKDIGDCTRRARTTISAHTCSISRTALRSEELTQTCIKERRRRTRRTSSSTVMRNNQ